MIPLRQLHMRSTLTFSAHGAIVLALSVVSWAAPALGNTPVQIKLVPVPPPADSKWAATSTYIIESKGDKGDTAVLSNGGEPVWFELHMTNFDPKGEGRKIGGFFARIDGSGYTSGLAGTVTPWTVNCGSNEDCVNQLGTLGYAPRCGPVGYPAEVCEYALIDTQKSDYVLQGGFTCIDPSGPDIGFCAATTSPRSEFLGPGEQYYMASLVFFVSANAKGQFTIGLKDYPDTTVTDENGEDFPFVSLVPGHVRIQTGACCTLDPAMCAEHVTAKECAAAGGDGWVPNGQCPQDCETCDATVVSEGSRHLKITPHPPGSPLPVALHVTSPDWSCLDKYVDANGRLVDSPVALTPDAWGTVVIQDPNLIPETTYEVVAECGTFVTTPHVVTTSLMGDSVGLFTGSSWPLPNGRVDLSDVIAQLQVFSDLPTAPEIQRVDLEPCMPDGEIRVRDVVLTNLSFQRLHYADVSDCPPPCP